MCGLSIAEFFLGLFTLVFTRFIHCLLSDRTTYLTMLKEKLNERQMGII